MAATRTLVQRSNFSKVKQCSKLLQITRHARPLSTGRSKSLGERSASSRSASGAWRECMHFAKRIKISSEHAPSACYLPGDWALRDLVFSKRPGRSLSFFSKMRLPGGYLQGFILWQNNWLICQAACICYKCGLQPQLHVPFHFVLENRIWLRNQEFYTR